MESTARILNLFQDNQESLNLDVIIGDAKESEARPADPFWEPEDILKLLNSFKEEGRMNHWLVCVIGFNTGRRTRDIVENLTWDKLFNENGTFKKELIIREQKTKKWARCFINDAVKDAVKEYCEYYNIDPVKDNYEGKVFVQLSGTYKGKVLTYDGFRKAFLKKVDAIGYDYPVNTRSMRKTFGYWSKMLHPNDPLAMQQIQGMFNHSSEAITLHYIGATDKKSEQFYSDFGGFFKGNVLKDGSDEIQIEKAKPVISLTNQSVAMLLAEAVRMARENSETNELDIVNKMLGRVDELAIS